MTEQEQYEQFRFLVVLYAQLYTSVEIMDTAKAKPYIKNVTRRKLNLALKELESDIKPFVYKLYEDEEEMIFQNLQEELAKYLVDITETQIEDIVNGELTRDNEQEEA